MSRIPNIKIAKWLTNRRESNILKYIQQHLDRVIDTISELSLALEAIKNNEKELGISALSRLNENEISADQKRRLIADELTKGEIPIKTREDLMNLTKVIDMIADSINDAGRNLKLLLDMNLPPQFLIKTEKITELAKIEAKHLKQAVLQLFETDGDCTKYIQKVEKFEQQIDELYFEIKEFILKEPSINSKVLVFTRDMIHHIEKASDFIEDAADVVRILRISYS
ncbi:MAG: DUF47 domain-containing protein [Candidatus Ranarchaeia archaeon]